jgi:hypothetical protein
VSERERFSKFSRAKKRHHWMPRAKKISRDNSGTRAIGLSALP